MKNIFPPLGYFTSFSELVPPRFIQYTRSISPESVPILSLPVWQIECGKEGMTGVT